MGFSIPLHRWLRSDLREWADSVLARIPADSELIDRRVVEAMWNEHQKGTRDRTQHLWHVLCLVSWCHENGVTP
jgi:asparagine synthase (glutamine-hydrolysing)